MNEIENCDLVEFDLDHVATSQFASLGEGMDQCLIEIEHERLLGRFTRNQGSRY
jgi:hypothetical protein